MENFKNTMSAIGPRLRKTRKQLHIQQKEIAKAVHMHPSYLCAIEFGKINPGLEFYINLASLYRINLNYLFLGEGDMLIKEEVKVKEEVFDLDDDIDSIEKIRWLMEKSIHMRTLLINIVNSMIYNDRGIIEMDIKKAKAKEKIKEL